MIRGGDYFKLGLFVIGGALLLLVVLFALGVGRFFQKTYKIETYINESVNGLEQGSAVRYRGVRVGSVTEIGFVAMKYGTKAEGYRYVYIECTLDRDLFGGMGNKPSEQQATDEVTRGLRARPISQGLTGQLYLGLDYVDPERNPALPIGWEPAQIYIPSAPSTLSRVEEAVLGISNTLNGMETADLPEAVKSFRRFADSASTVLEGTDVREVGVRLSATLEQTRKLLTRINTLVEDPAVDNLLPDAAKTVAGARKLVEGSGGDAAILLREARETTTSLKASAKALEGFLTSPETKRQLAEMPGAMQQARETVGELKSAAMRLNAVLGRVENLTASQQANVESVLDNARQLIENLRELTGEAKRYPSGMLFGPPPSKSPLGGQ
ncbi:MAG: MlaD family protein [Humidesulfovibrio sp.]